MSMNFNTGEELLALCRSGSQPIHAVMLARELEFGEQSEQDIYAELARDLDVMRASVQKGLEERQSSVTGLTGGDAERLYAYAKRAFCGPAVARAAAASMAVVEVNAGMGRILAAPTAGASGILPGALLTAGELRGWDDGTLINGLLTAGAVGYLVAHNATISGADGGCQAETGAAAAMAAAAIAELGGAKPEAALDAAAIALKNVLGLVCDPVAGLVECPCIKRNALGAANALLAADMALSGIKSIIPFDEVVSAMLSVGRLMSPDLRETAKGGLAATPTGRRIKKQAGGNTHE